MNDAAGEPCICAGNRRIWVVSVPFLDGEGAWQWHRQSVPCPELYRGGPGLGRDAA